MLSAKGKFLSCGIIYEDNFIVAYLKHTIMMPLAHFKFTWNAIAMCFKEPLS